jgi:hypothetical protein
MAEVFRYKVVGDSAYGLVYRPVAKVGFISVKSKLRTNILMTVDTGADFTLLPRSFAKSLEVSLWLDCRRQVTQGVGGKQRIFFLKNRIQIHIGEIMREIPVGFFDSDEMPALLGRIGALETMNVEFRKSRQVVFSE